MGVVGAGYRRMLRDEGGVDGCGWSRLQKNVEG